MEADKYRFLDIGGGAELDARNFDAQRLAEDINNLRGVRLAEENPGNEYVIFDAYIPTQIAAQKASEIPNLHFVIGRIATNQYLPFNDASMDRVEMNHMFTPLILMPQKPRREYYVVPEDVTLYLHALKEACRVLKPGGALAITEKQERLNKIRRLLSDSSGDMIGFRMTEFGLDTDWRTQKITRVTDSNRTIYTGIAMEQQRSYEEQGYDKEAVDCIVFTLELRKKR